MHATLKGNRLSMGIFPGKKLCNSFQGKQETLSHFLRKFAHHLPKGGQSSFFAGFVAFYNFRILRNAEL